MTPQECKEVLKIELKKIGFQKSGNYWSKKQNEITFVINIQTSFYSNDYCCNFGMSIDGYTDGVDMGKFFCQIWTRIQNSNSKFERSLAGKETNPEPICILAAVQKYMTECGSIEQIKDKYVTDESFRKTVLYTKFRKFLEIS